MNSRGQLGWRSLVAAIFVALLAALLGVGATTVVPHPDGVVARAHATPKPGQPGGNHSKPGDNKKKKNDGENSRRNNNNGDSGPNRSGQSSNGQRDQTDPNSDRDQTNENNGWTPDGDRSVDVRVTREQQPNTPAWRDDSSSTQSSQDPESVPEGQRSGDSGSESPIPPSHKLSPQERAAYGNIGNLPSQATKDRMNERIAAGELEYNRDPYNTGTDTDLPPEADHLVPRYRIAQMPGFADLDRDEQRRIADIDENIYPAAQFENGSRKARTFAEYAANGPNQSGTPLDPDYRAMRIGQENEAYRALQQQIDQAWATKFGSARPSSGPLEVELNQPPLGVDPRPSPPELPAAPSPPEVPVTPAPVELAPISVAPQLPPTPATVGYPLPPARPATPPVIGVPVAPTTFAAPPPVTIPAPSPVGVPAPLTGWSTPPLGPVAIPSGADPLALLSQEQNFLQTEANSILARQEALQALPGFDTNAPAIAEYQGLRALAPQVAARESAIASGAREPA